MCVCVCVYVWRTHVQLTASFVYLGSLVDPDSRVGLEVDRRLASASCAFGALRCVFNTPGLSIGTKKMLYETCVLTVLLYGAECWPVLRRDEIHIDNFHHQCLRCILGVSCWDQELNDVRNCDLRKRWRDEDLVSDTMRRRRLQWLGHVARMRDNRLPKQLLFGWLDAPRPAQGPRLRWKDRIQSDMKLCQIDEWFTLAQDRQQWRDAYRTHVQGPALAPLSCLVCKRTFKSKSGLGRHKCSADSL